MIEARGGEADAAPVCVEHAHALRTAYGPTDPREAAAEGRPHAREDMFAAGGHGEQELVVLTRGRREFRGPRSERPPARRRYGESRGVGRGADPARPAEMPQVLHDAVAHVDHRVRDAGEGEAGAHARRRLRKASAAARAQAAYGEARGPHRPGQVERVPGPRAGAADDPPWRVADERDRDGEATARGQVAAHEPRPRAARRSGEAVDQRVQL